MRWHRKGVFRVGMAVVGTLLGSVVRSRRRFHVLLSCLCSVCASEVSKQPCRQPSSQIGDNSKQVLWLGKFAGDDCFQTQVPSVVCCNEGSRFLSTRFLRRTVAPTSCSSSVHSSRAGFSGHLQRRLACNWKLGRNDAGSGFGQCRRVGKCIVSLPESPQCDQSERHIEGSWS